MRHAVALLLIVFLAMATQARAQNWADFATVSMTNPTTPKLTANRLCYTDGTDMLCDGAAGLLITSGTLQITNISTTNAYANTASFTTLYVGGVAVTGGATGDRITSGTTGMVANSATSIISITNAGVTAGYFNSNGVLTAPGISATSNLTSVTTLYASGKVGIGRTAPVATLDVAGTISSSGAMQIGTSTLTCATGISGTMRYSTTSSTMEYCNGSVWTSMGPSSTQPVAFMVNRNGTNQTVTNNGWTKIQFSNKVFDTNSSFDAATNYRFTPTVPGYYLLTAATYCTDATNSCYPAIYKNGTAIAQGGVQASVYNAPGITTVTYLNGSTDYVEAWVNNNGGTTLGGTANLTYFGGVILGPQASGSGGATPAGNTADVQYNSGGALAADTGNLTYASSVLKAPTVSATNINANAASATTLYVASSAQVSGSLQFSGTGSESCSSAADYGKNRRNPTSGRMQVCLFR